MIKPEMVPDNVEEHFRWCAANTFMTTRECLAAALNAWPGMQYDTEHEKRVSYLILPLMEKTDDQA